MEPAASQKASPVMDAWSMANFERYSMNCHIRRFVYSARKEHTKARDDENTKLKK